MFTIITFLLKIQEFINKNIYKGKPNAGFGMFMFKIKVNNITNEAIPKVKAYRDTNIDPQYFQEIAMNVAGNIVTRRIFKDIDNKKVTLEEANKLLENYVGDKKYFSNDYKKINKKYNSPKIVK